jgi:hypothetical protein
VMLIAKAAAWFGARSLLAKLLTYLAIAAGIGGAYYAWRSSIYNEGYRAAIDDVEAANQEASENARKAIDGVRHCRERGGLWSQSTGQCDRGV